MLAFLIYWCACHKSHPNENRDPFTEDQLQWIECIENPSYKVSTKELDTAGNEITVVDTLVANTNSGTSQMSDVINDEYVIRYYSGSYQFQLGFGDSSFYSIIKINNEFEFTSIIYLNVVDNVITNYNTDTAKINNTVFTNVYKFENLPNPYSADIAKCYYKKGMGFLYFEKTNGDKAEIIQ